MGKNALLSNTQRPSPAQGHAHVEPLVDVGRVPVPLIEGLLASGDGGPAVGRVHREIVRAEGGLDDAPQVADGALEVRVAAVWGVGGHEVAEAHGEERATGSAVVGRQAAAAIDDDDAPRTSAAPTASAPPTRLSATHLSATTPAVTGG